MKNKKGFTLVELLAVIVILAILATAAFTLVLPQIEKGRKKSFVSEIANIIDSAEIYFVENPGETSVSIADLKPYIKNWDSAKVGCVVAPSSSNKNYQIRFSNGSYRTEGEALYEIGDLKEDSGTATDNVVKVDRSHSIFTDGCTLNIINNDPSTDEQIGYTPESCFTVSNNGVLTGYDMDNCGTELVIPPEVNGVVIKELASGFAYPKGLSLFKVRMLPDITKLDISKMYGLEKIDFCASGANYSNYSNACVFKYRGYNYELIIPDNVTIIENNAFESYSGPYLKLSNSLQTIGSAAFYAYRGEGQELIIPDSVKKITGPGAGNGAFRSFVGNSLKISKNLKDIPGLTFENYNGDELIIPEGIETIQFESFAHFDGKKLSLPSTLKYIGNKAFQNYTGTDGGNQTLVIPNGLTTLGLEAFKYYVGNDFEVPASVIEIPAGEFEYDGSHVFSSFNGTITVHNQYLKDNENKLAPNANVIYR